MEIKDEAEGEQEEEDVDENGLCEYEREREARIAQNRARLAALQLPGLADQFAAKHAAKPKPARPRGLAAKKIKKARGIHLSKITDARRHRC